MEANEILKASDGTVKPHSSEAEAALLGSMLIDPDIVGLVTKKITAEDAFYNKINGLVFAMIAEVSKRGQPTDIVTVYDYYEREKSNERVNGSGKTTYAQMFPKENVLEYLTKLATSVASSANFGTYADIVYRDFCLRRLIDVCNESIRRAYNTTDFESVLQDAQREIFEVSRAVGDVDLKPIGKATTKVMQRMDELSRNAALDIGIKTGFHIFDRNTGGLHDTDLLILAARPAVGKTTFALNLLLNIARADNKKNIIMFSLEMSDFQLAQRLIANDAQVPMNDIQGGSTNERVISSMWDSSSRLGATNVYFDDSGELTPEALISKCRRHVNMHGKIDLIIIDYLQLMNGGREFVGKDNRNQEISKISRKLKVYAKELNCPIIALSQMSRSIEKRESRIPVLSDLRESGSIEQDADIVMFLYADEDQSHPGAVILDIAKHRNGPTFKERLDFKRENNRFTESENQIINEAVFQSNYKKSNQPAAPRDTSPKPAPEPASVATQEPSSEPIQDPDPVQGD